MSTWTTWASGVLGGIGAPVTAVNLDTLFSWSSAESGTDLMRWNNPLNTTQPEGAGNVDANSVGVKIYPTVQQGIAATVKTLLNGYYPRIVGHLRKSVPRAQWSDCCAELGTWGTGCAWISRFYGDAPGIPTQPIGGIDLTSDEHDALMAIKAQVCQGYSNQRIFKEIDSLYDGTNLPAEDGLRQLIGKLQPNTTTPAVDLSGLSAALSALTAKVDVIAGSVADIKAKVDKDLA